MLINGCHYHFTEEEIGTELWVILLDSHNITDLWAIGKNENGYYIWNTWDQTSFDIYNREEAKHFIDLASNDGWSEGMYDTFAEADSKIVEASRDRVSLLRQYEDPDKKDKEDK